MEQRTLVLLKPDAVQRGLIGPIVTRLEQRGLKIVAMKMMQATPELAARHYGIHKGKAFYEPLVSFITSGPIVALVVQGKGVIDIVRATMGVTNPAQAAPGTIRADYGLEIGRNLVHGSDGPDTAATEIPLFFEESEILEYTRESDRWIHE